MYENCRAGSKTGRAGGKLAPNDLSGTEPVLDKKLIYLHLAPSNDLPALDFPPFLTILVVESVADEMWRFELCRRLAASNCRYLLAWGPDCEAWRESAEDAFLEATDYEDVAPERALLTTAHEDEDVEEVFWFARHRAAHPGLSLDTVLILHVAQQPDRDRLLQAYKDA